MGEEIFIAIFVFLLVVTVLLVGPILAMIALVRTGRIKRLEQEVSRLAQELQALRTVEPGAVSRRIPPVAEVERSAAAGPIDVELVEAELVSPLASSSPPARGPAVAASMATPATVREAPRELDGRALELFIGRQALGWVAVVVLLFGAVFFLRYAYENEWIGPLGRVSIGVLAGTALICGGWRYARAGWRTFSQMLLAAGVLVLYVATYSAFGFYQLVPPRAAGLLLLVVILETAGLALVFESWGVALMAVVGGLLTPLLLHSDHDQYVSLFTYLALLNLGALAMLARRAWHAIGTVALVGTQLLFLAWFVENYHPEKLAWGVGFQLTLFGLHWGHSLWTVAGRRQSTTVEEIVRASINATATFGALYLLLADQHREWLGVAAVGMAAIEAWEARLLVKLDSVAPVRIFTAVAISFGFVALAFPLQAETHWVAVGWGAQAAVLSWFGLRIESIALRGLSFVLAIMSGLRILIENAPWTGRPAFYPLWNDFATPALAVVVLLLGSLVLSRRRLAIAPYISRLAAGALTVGCVLLVWFVLSFDVYQYFETYQQRADGTFPSATSLGAADDYANRIERERLAQMSLSACWAIFASAVLACGFKLRLGILRWTALGLFALTVFKVFVADMAGLDEIYRIVAFLLLAVLLGAAAWAYQRLSVRDDRDDEARRG